MKKLRILFLTSAYEKSSSYYRAFFLSKYLAQRGHDVSLIATGGEAKSRAVKKVVNSVNILLLPSPAKLEANLLLSWLSIAFTVIMQTPFNCILDVALDFDVLHSTDVMFPQNAAPTLLSRLRNFFGTQNHKIFVDWDDWWGRGGLLTHYGGTYSLIDPWATFLEEKVPKHADAVTVINETLRKRALSVGVKSQNLFIIPNGADTNFIKPLDITDSRKRLNLPVADVIYTHLGNLDKGTIKLLMLAHRKVIRKHRKALLLFVGLSGDRIDFVKSLGVKNVSCIEWQPYSKVPLYLGASDICLLPLQDTLFNQAACLLRLCDYLAAGRPVIAAALTEPKIMIEDSGLLVRPDNPEDFADKISNLIEDLDLRKQMGERGRKIAETKYSWQVIARQLEDAYRHYL